MVSIKESVKSPLQKYDSWFFEPKRNAVVIGAFTDDEEKLKYYAIDRTSGGYPYWTDNLFLAEKFVDSQQARERLEKELSYPRSNYSDGTSSPNPTIHSLLNLSNSKPKGSAALFLAQVGVISVGPARVIEDKIERIKLVSDIDWRDLYILQSKHNNNTGIESVRNICEALEEENFPKAILLAKNASDEITKYSDVHGWLIRAEIMPAD